MFIGGIPIVSLDKVYLEPESTFVEFLDCTRLDGSSELVSRKNPNDFESVDRDIQTISNKLKNSNYNGIVLADDVVFSGNVLKSIIDKFASNGISVLGIRSCISMRESYDYFNRELPLGLKCGCVMEDDVIDQICERDFYFGIPQSGISIKSNDTVVKAPYFRPYGDPVARASVPSFYEDYFSKGCLIRSLALWDRINTLTNREVLVRELPEVISNTNSSDSVVKTLKREINMNRDTRNIGVSR